MASNIFCTFFARTNKAAIQQTFNVRIQCAVRSSRWFSTPTIDGPFDVVVFGGNGFVGSNVCKKLAGMGKKVAAVNRSGCPKSKEPWMNQITYIPGDVFSPEAWRNVLKGAGGVVASIGGFGSYAEMRRINGDANIVVAEEAAAAGVGRFVFVSASFPPFPASIPLQGYIEGKEMVEAAARRLFPATHTILKPSVIYGAQEGAHPLIAGIRSLGPIQNPLMSSTPLQNLSSLPVIGGVFLPWSPVESVAAAAAAAAVGDVSIRTLMPADINGGRFK